MLRKSFLVVLFSIGMCSLANPIKAQIQPVEPTVVNQSGQESVIDAGVLSEDGKNIFHTFEQFGLTQEQIANFLAHPDTENIFNRVLGNNPSFIDGLIKITGGSPDFYFLNPNGVIFGQNAQINVPAALHVSTATSLQFGNDGFPLYAGPEWFSTPFAIGEGIQASNGDPTFLIFGAGLSNPILNLGTIQAEKIDLSGSSVVSLGDLQAEDIRFSVGFNSIPWKLATNSDFWAIVPRSAFSSVYPIIDLEIQEDFEDKDIFVFSDPVARGLFIATLTFEPFNVSTLFVGLGDVVLSRDVQVFRVGNLGQNFSINLDLAIQPDTPDDLIDISDDPVVDDLVVDDSVVDDPVVDDPVVDDSVVDDPVVDDSVVDDPDDLIDDLVDDPIVDEPDDLIDDLVDDPIVDEPDNSIDDFQIDKVDFSFWDTSKLLNEEVNFILIQPRICYNPQLFQDNRLCLLQLNTQNQNYPEMTREQFYEQFREHF